MRRLTPTAAAMIIGGLLLIMLIAYLLFRGGSEQDKLSDEQVASATAANPEKACAAQSTYNEIKRELFRQAAATRGQDAATYDRLANYATIVVDRPHLAGEVEEIGAVKCAATIRLVVPPGVAAVGGRRQLEAEAEYVVQAAADGSGPSVTLSGVDAITVPLATLAKIGSVSPQPDSPEATIEEPSEPTVPDEPEAFDPPPAAAPTPSAASPSFDCRAARTRSEIAVCANPALASLDRDMARFYGQAMANADPEQAGLLRSTRDRFLGYRERCTSESCIASTYRGRISEIRDIMDGRWRP